MAKKHKAEQQVKYGITASTTTKEVAVGKEAGISRSAHLWLMAGIVIVTGLFFSTCLDNQFTGWDDPGYINDNPYIKDLTLQGLAKIFSVQVMGNYHPLTILSYAIEYRMVQLEPWLYHFDSLVLHLIVTVLVYWFVVLLSGRPVAAVITALLFGIHPMHVESVAWVSGRKDVLYGVFYVGACIAYLYYLAAENGRRAVSYSLVLILYVLALLAKPVAVTLPVALLLIDYYKERTWNKKNLIEKIPHFLLAIAFGIISINVQHAAGAMAMQKIVYAPWERLALGGYALTTYLWKAVIPASLCCYYPYPLKVNGVLPLLYYAYPAIAGAVIYLVWRYGRKNRLVVFGTLFFIGHIALLLQFLPVGDAIVADRYSYIPYLGLFFIAGICLSELYLKYGYIILAAAAAYIGILGIVSRERCKDWYDSMSLWQDEIAKAPAQAQAAYNNLGFIYYSKWSAATNVGDKVVYYDSAIYCMNKAIALKPDFANPYVAMGELMRNAGQYAEAKKHYYRALTILPKESNLYVGMAILYYINKEYDSCGYYFRGALRLNPSAESHGNYANYLSVAGKTDSAIYEFGIAISMNPDMYSSYQNRANLYQDAGRWEDALSDINKAIRLNPDLGELYYLRSKCDTHFHDKGKAMQDLEKATSLGYKADKGYYEALKNL